MPYSPASDRYQRLPYARCGRSGLMLPRISLGLWHNFGGVDPIENQRALVRHALRSLIKQTHPQALALLGHGHLSALQVQSSQVEPQRPRIGDSVRLRVVLDNPSTELATALVDWRGHHTKADGRSSPKVFKGSTVRVPPGAQQVLEKTWSLRQMSTRTHHTGRHAVEVLINGQAHDVGAFDLQVA